MKFIFKRYYGQMRSLRAELGGMINSRAEVGNAVSHETWKKADDFMEMYNQFVGRVVFESRSNGIYNGDPNGDIFAGKNGTRIQGLGALKKFGEEVRSEIAAAVKAANK